MTFRSGLTRGDDWRSMGGLDMREVLVKILSAGLIVILGMMVNGLGTSKPDVQGVEAAIRDYDPCISCATHFLDLTVERSDTCASD